MSRTHGLAKLQLSIHPVLPVVGVSKILARSEVEILPYKGVHRTSHYRLAFSWGGLFGNIPIVRLDFVLDGMSQKARALYPSAFRCKSSLSQNPEN